jgi:hypothetical protein
MLACLLVHNWMSERVNAINKVFCKVLNIWTAGTETPVFLYRSHFAWNQQFVQQFVQQFIQQFVQHMYSSMYSSLYSSMYSSL